MEQKLNDIKKSKTGVLGFNSLIFTDVLKRAEVKENTQIHTSRKTNWKLERHNRERF